MMCSYLEMRVTLCSARTALKTKNKIYLVKCNQNWIMGQNLLTPKQCICLANQAKYTSFWRSTLFRGRDYPPFSPHILQVLMEVPLIIHTHKISALSTSPDGPRKVMLEEQFPLPLIESCRTPNDRQQTHWKVHLLKLDHLQSWLADQVGRKIKEGMPEVMHLSSPHSNKCKLICLHKPHRWSVIRGEVPWSHEFCIGSTKCVFWEVPCVPHFCRYDSRLLKEYCLSKK